MKVWLIKAGEALPVDKPKDRLKRMGILAKELDSRGHQVTWFNSTFNHSKKIKRFNKDKLIKVSENYQIRLINSNSYKNISLSRIKNHIETAKKFNKLAYSLEKPDIILCSMPTIDLAEQAVDYGKKMNVPVIIDIRDLWPDIFIDTVPTFARTIIKPYVYSSKVRLSRLLSNAYAIIGLTDGFLKWGLSYAGRIKGKNDKVFKMAYELSSTAPADPYREWSNLQPNDFIICFFGHLGHQFNLEPIIQAAFSLEEYTDIKFVICGNGDSLRYLKKKTSTLNNIHFPGWVNQQEIQSLLSISSIGIAPYKESINFTLNIPNKFGEYLSAGLPIFLGIEGEMSKLVEKNECGFLYKDGLDLSRAILKFKNDNIRREFMSQNAKKLFIAEFEAKKVYGELINYLEGIVIKSTSNTDFEGEKDEFI